MKGRIFMPAVFAAVSLGLFSCQRIPMYNARSNYALDAVLDTAGLYDVSASMIAVNFYDPNTGKLVYETYQVPGRSFLGGFSAGTYRMLVYNYDTKVTSVYEKNAFDNIYASAEVLSYSGSVPVMKAPDHLLLCRDTLITVPVVTDGEEAHVITAPLKPETSGLEFVVHGVHNATIAKTVTMYLSGQERYDIFGQGRKPGDQAVLQASGGAVVSGTKAAADTVVRSRFATFGVSPKASRCMFTMLIIGPANSSYTAQEDVTEKLAAALSDGNPTHRVDIYVDITVEPRKDGGFDPGASEWNDNIEDIDIK